LTPPRPSRRVFVSTVAATAAILALPRELLLAAPPRFGIRLTTRFGIRLTSRPGKPKHTIAPGLRPLGLDPSERDGRIYVPTSRDPKKPAPLMLALHGATQNHEVMTNRLSAFADTLGCVLLAPDSRGMSWDAIRGDFAEDVAFIDGALAWTFDRVAIDPARIWLAGFSDGASYGISLGIANGDLFSRILAFSPGFVIPAEHRGRPRIFVSHGRNDQILPIEQTSRRIVPDLERQGYDVRYVEFDGGHRMAPDALTVAAEWLRAPAR